MRRGMRWVGGVALILGALAAGCGGDGTESGTPPEEEAVPERTATETLVIGELDGPEEYTFGRVTGLAADDDGRIYVADSQASAVRVYAPDGRHLLSVARHGQGPGELAGPCCLTVDERGRLWVREGGNNRYSAFRIESDSVVAFEETRRMQHGAGGQWTPLHVVGDSVVDVGAEFGSPDRLRWMVGPGNAVRPLSRATGRDLDEIGAGVVITAASGESTIRRFFYQPFGPRHLMAFSPDGSWADAVSSTPRVVLHPPDGDSVIIEGAAARGPLLSDAERDAAGETIEGSRRMAGSDADRLGFEVPDRKPPLRDLYFDEEGRLWVELSVPDGEPREARIHAPDGSLLERRSWSGDVDISLPGWIGSDAAVGVRRDSLEVQRVVRVEWPAGG